MVAFTIFMRCVGDNFSRDIIQCNICPTFSMEYFSQIWSEFLGPYFWIKNVFDTLFFTQNFWPKSFRCISISINLKLTNKLTNNSSTHRHLTLFSLAQLCVFLKDPSSLCMGLCEYFVMGILETSLGWAVPSSDQLKLATH